MSLLPAAIGIILNDDHSQVLLVKRSDIPIWVLPGGGVDCGETPEEALLREIREESGYHVEIDRKCAEYTPVNRLSAFTSLFFCHICSGTPHLSDETVAVSFFPLDNLPKSFFYLHAAWLNEVLHTQGVICRPLYEVSYGALLKYFILHPWTVIRFAWTRFYKQPLSDKNEN